MSCAYRTHCYRSSVTAHPVSVSWGPTTGHAQHPIPLRLPVVHPERQMVTETSTSTDNASIPVSLVQYLCAQWQALPLGHQSTVAAILGELMRSPRWHWDVTVLPDHSLSDPQHSFVSERDGRPTIGVPIAILRELWRWVLYDTEERASILRWWSIDPVLWQHLRAWQMSYAPEMTPAHWYRLYPYLLPAHLPELVQEMHHLLASADPNDQHIALTVLDRWLASPDHETRTVAAQMLHSLLNEEHHLRLPIITILAASGDATMDVKRWAHHAAAFIRTHPSDRMIQAMLDRLMPAILSSVRPDDRVAWVATLWDLVNESTLGERCLMIAGVLEKLMQQDPMVARLVYDRLRTVVFPTKTRWWSPGHWWRLVYDRLRTVLLLHRSQLPPIPGQPWDTLLVGLMRTVYAGEVLESIAQAIRQDPDTIFWFDRIVAAGWGNGYDHRILQIIDSVPGPHWETVLTEGVTTLVGAEVCARIQSWFPRDQARAMIVDHIHARERRGDWPLAPLPAYLIPWVCDAVCRRPNSLHPTTIRRLWLTNPDQAWHVTQTMLDSGHHRAIAAMDAGWGTGHDAAMATILRSIILDHQNDPSVARTGTTTVVAGLGTAPPPIMESLLTELAMKGNATVQQQLISILHRGWGRGQDALVLRVVAIIADRDSSESIWADAHETLIRAWRSLPPHMVVFLVDRLLTRATNRLAKAGPFSPLGLWGVPQIIAAFAPIWTHLPTPQGIERIAYHVAHLHAHAHTMTPTTRDTLVAAWASVIAAGAARLSASDIHAVLAPLWTLSPHGCLDGMVQWVYRWCS
jgi:hypothetical protein